MLFSAISTVGKGVVFRRNAPLDLSERGEKLHKKGEGVAASGKFFRPSMKSNRRFAKINRRKNLLNRRLDFFFRRFIFVGIDCDFEQVRFHAGLTGKEKAVVRFVSSNHRHELYFLSANRP